MKGKSLDDDDVDGKKSVEDLSFMDDGGAVPSWFEEKYWERLDLDRSSLDVEPTIAKLRRICESHLGRVPFENSAQHGATKGVGRMQTLDIVDAAQKILLRRRGGFCLESNGLLAFFLERCLGYRVKLLPARVHVGTDVDGTDDDGFRSIATHMILLVQIPSKEKSDKHETTTTALKGEENNFDEKGEAVAVAEEENDDDGDEDEGNHHNRTWLVDVAFGEPAIHPLKYDVGTTTGLEKCKERGAEIKKVGEVQTTPDGMQSRLVVMVRRGENHDHDDDEDDHDDDDDNNNNDDDNKNVMVVVVLEWWKDSMWTPRLEWKLEGSSFVDDDDDPTTTRHHDLSLSDFGVMLHEVQKPTSPFSKKFICTRLTRTEKFTIAGNKFKHTGPPRFGTMATKHVRELSSVEEVRDVLENQFGIPREETEGLDLTRSVSSSSSIFSSL